MKGFLWGAVDPLYVVAQTAMFGIGLQISFSMNHAVALPLTLLLVAIFVHAVLEPMR